MLRKNIYLTQAQVAFLKSINDLSVAEHIRRAIDEYIVRLTIRVSTSSSLTKGVHRHG